MPVFISWIPFSSEFSKQVDCFSQLVPALLQQIFLKNENETPVSQSDSQFPLDVARQKLPSVRKTIFLLLLYRTINISIKTDCRLPFMTQLLFVDIIMVVVSVVDVAFICVNN